MQGQRPGTNDHLEITISEAPNRNRKKWQGRRITWGQFKERLQHPVVGSHTAKEYRAMPGKRRTEVKDVGGFVGGSLKEGLRQTNHVASRTLITFDLDEPGPQFFHNLKLLFNYEWAMYCTHSHTPKQPRYRVIFPLQRAVQEKEYEPVSRMLASLIDIESVDKSSYDPVQLMFWPSVPGDIDYVFESAAGELVDPDYLLQQYGAKGLNREDIHHWPRSHKEKALVRRKLDKAPDPTGKAGVVGAFCRSYDIHRAIEAFLPGVYLPCGDDRYTYADGSAAGGLVVYDGGVYAYSHHSTDPGSGKLCNAFDLVRLHRFRELDKAAKEDTPVNKLPSYLAMQDLATGDGAVKKQIAAERIAAAAEEFGQANWQEGLEITKYGEIKETLSNIVLILRHDESLEGIAFNEHRDGIDVNGKISWKRVKEGWCKADEAGLAYHLEHTYKIWSPGKCKEALMKVAMERSFHPVRDYLENLPEWDRVERVDRLLIDCLGAGDSAYVRAVTRKTLCAAVGRVYNPGVKFDTMLVLNGPQGTGKSTLFAKLAGQWFSDSLSIYDMRDKTAAEKLQGNWIVEIGELTGIRKIDVEKVKSFLSCQDDKYRASYGYHVESHPRQCIVVGSTNSESGFLRDITGNRRFWPVRVSGKGAFRPWEIKDIDQIWAEAVAAYKAGETLYLDNTLEKDAVQAQIDALETDEREGLIREYLNTPLPQNWYELSIYERRAYLRQEDFGGELSGSLMRQQVCTLEIWCELFGKEPGTLRRQDAYELNGIMRRIEGWDRHTGNKSGNAKVPGYGVQRVFSRKQDR